MNQITRYLFLRMLGSFAMVYAFALSASWLILVLALFSLVTVKGQDFSVLLTQTLLSTVTPAAFLLPICGILGLARTFGALRARHEIDTIHATGAVGPIHGAVFAFVVFIGGLSGVLEHFGNPAAIRAIDLNLQRVNADLIARSSQAGSYIDLATGVTLRIDRRATDGGAQSFFLYDRTNPEQTRTFMATSADITEEEGAFSVDLRNGSIQYLDIESGNLSTVSFERYSLSLGQFPQSVGVLTPGFRSQTTFELLSGPLAISDPARVGATVGWRFALMFLAISFPVFAYGFVGHPTGARTSRWAPPELILVGAGVLMEVATGLLAIYVERENLGAWPVLFAPGAGVLGIAGIMLLQRYWLALWPVAGGARP
ncbi:MAG: LptF/LptG family permease [Alphaproteobacteria bacterium]|nr:LptF/LptG family permease [Alphaproteobacteria bacterium]